MPLVLSPRNWPLNSAGLKKVLAQTFGDCARRRNSEASSLLLPRRGMKHLLLDFLGDRLAKFRPQIKYYRKANEG
jgi:hypothetical protein